MDQNAFWASLKKPEKASKRIIFGVRWIGFGIKMRKNISSLLKLSNMNAIKPIQISKNWLWLNY